MNVSVFRKVALIEATSFLLLLVASVLKRTSDLEILVKILGPIHGVLFLAYIAIALSIRSEEGWTTGQTVGILFGAVVPFGGYVVDWWLKGRETAPPKPKDL